MRFPLVRSGNDGTPVTWWEICSAPVVVPILLAGLTAVAILSLPIALLYPERKLAATFDESTPEGRELIAKFNRREARTPFWKRLAAAPLVLIVAVVAIPVLTLYDLVCGPWRPTR
jgi:hypothetical protein